MRRHAVGQRGETDEDPFFGNAFGRVIRPIVNLASAMPALAIGGRAAMAHSLPHWGVLVGYAMALHGWYIVYLFMRSTWDPRDQMCWGGLYTCQVFTLRYVMPPTLLVLFATVAVLALLA